MDEHVELDLVDLDAPELLEIRLWREYEQALPLDERVSLRWYRIARIKLFLYQAAKAGATMHEILAALFT